ncbi:MAG: S41 family peptidase [Candidatus Gracilibacteria bacterium]|jgi:carboxyl-terminal processing protease
MKKIIPAILFSLLLAVQTSFAAFEDVPTTHPYYDGISYLELVGAVDPAAEFRPDDKVTRAEFFKILFKILGEDLEIPEKSSFTDVSPEAWFAPYAEFAAQSKLIEDEVFEGEKTLERVKSLATAMKAYGLSAPIIPSSQRQTLFDDIGVKHPFYSILVQASRIGIVNTSLEENFRPYKSITRGELADQLYRLESWENDTLAQEVSSDFYKSDIFADIWNRILEEFYLPDGFIIDKEILFQAAVNGVLESLNDPYSMYFSASEASEFSNALEGEFEGIGVILMQDEENLEIFIAEILENSPASASGLKSEDQLMAVDGVSIEGMAMEEVLARIKGNAGTEVEITIERDGKSYSYVLVRAQIALNLVKGKIYNGDAWFIDIDSFGSNIYAEMMETLQELEAEEPNPSAVILDLRNNPGGYINMSNFVAGLFVPQLTPLVSLDYGGFEESIVNGDTGPYQDIPVYILVNGYSASASEILALTLQEVAGATVIGTQTFGKGSAQEIITYWDGSLLKLTIAHWLSSQGNSVQGVGVTPDIVLSETVVEEDEWLKALNDAL